MLILFVESESSILKNTRYNPENTVGAVCTLLPFPPLFLRDEGRPVAPWYPLAAADADEELSGV